MEGLLVILVSAISLSLFLQQQQRDGKRTQPNPYFYWDDWSEQEGFSFTPTTADAPMNIVAKISPYTVYMYAKPKQVEGEVPREERFYTEIRVPLRFTLASGFWMQSRKGLEKIRLTKTATLLEFKRGNMDELFFVESKDPHTGQWVLDQPAYREVLDQFKDLPPKSRLEQRNLVWACDSVDIVVVAQELAKAVQAANALDEESVKAWKHWSEELNWSLHKQHGYPMMWGRQNDVRLQVSIPDTQHPYIEFQAEFPPSFPKDVGLWGFEFIKEGQNLTRIANDMIWFQEGEHERALDLPSNKLLMQLLEGLFKERPKSYLAKGLLQVRFPGKQNTILDKHLKNWIDLCAQLQLHFNPPPPEPTLEDLETGAQ